MCFYSLHLHHPSLPSFPKVNLLLPELRSSVLAMFCCTLSHKTNVFPKAFLREGNEVNLISNVQLRLTEGQRGLTLAWMTFMACKQLMDMKRQHAVLCWVYNLKQFYQKY